MKLLISVLSQLKPAHPAKTPSGLGMPKALGQGMNEYLLIGGLVAVVGIVSLTALGGNVNGLFTNMIGQNTTINNTSNNTNALANPSTGSPNPSVPGIPQAGGNPPGPTVITTPVAGQSLKDMGVASLKITLPSGRTLNLPVADPTNAMETLGPNGVTNQYLAMIEAMITQLQGEPGSEPVVNNLARLAMAGHNVANQQMLSEAELGNSINDVYRSLTQDNIDTMSNHTNGPSNLAGTFGSKLSFSGKQPLDFNQAIIYNGSDVDYFFMKAKDARNQMYGDYAALKPVLDMLVTNIMGSSQMTLNNLQNQRPLLQKAYDTGMNQTQVGLDGKRYFPNNAYFAPQEVYGTFTEANANSICGMSNSGTQCMRKDGAVVQTTPPQESASR